MSDTLRRPNDIAPVGTSEHVLVIEKALITVIIVVELHEKIPVFKIGMSFVYKT
jgi:hypothetical protein